MSESPLEVYETLPIVPLRDVVIFPHMMMPFVIGRPSSTRALEHALHFDAPLSQLSAGQRAQEQLGGIYVVDVKDLNEAMAWAAKIPDARTGSIEIRPLMNIPEM